jgi:glycosyltransferase involved in cell wall biosynthesis
VIRLFCNNPLISIIIPVYNGYDYLKEAIDSALAQTYENIEVIVINDGSNDEGKTAAIGKSYDIKIRYYEKINGGVASALNYGIEKMKGDFFSWLSHDDLYYPDKIEKQLEILQEQPSKTIIFSHSDLINANGRVIIKGRPLKFRKNYLYYDILANNLFISGCTLLIPKKAFNEVGFFTDRYQTVQDYDMWFRMFNVGYRLEYLPLATVQTRVHPNQDSKAKANLFIEEKNIFYTEALDWFKRELWLDYWDNKAVALLLMAKNYKRGHLDKAYHRALQWGKEEIRRLPFPMKAHAKLCLLYVYFWNKYLSPYSYINKMKLVLGRLK